MKATLSNAIVVLALVSLCFSSAAASAKTTRKKVGFSSARNATIPLFRSGEESPYATVRFEVLKEDRQKRGFFKIGLLPILVIQGVEVEVSKAEDLAAVFQQLPKTLNALPQDGLTFKHFRLRARGQPESVLTAQEATVSGVSDSVTLRDVRLRGGTTISEARLMLTGINQSALVAENKTLGFLDFSQTNTSTPTLKK